MSISNLTIQNFKSINHVEMQLGAFNVLIGANAAGKTNIVQAVKFLKDLVKEGFENALSLQGGSKYFSHSKLKFKGEEDSTFIIDYYLPGKNFEIETSSSIIIGQTHEISYLLTVGNYDEALSVQDSMQAGTRFTILDTTSSNEQREEEINGAREQLKRLSQSNTPLEVVHIIPEDYDSRIVYDWLNQNEFLYSYKVTYSSSKFEPFLLHHDKIFGSQLRDILTELGIYDLNTLIMKQSGSSVGIKELESDGSNLILVLKNLLDDKEKCHQFILLLEYALPFIKNVKVESMHGQSLVALLTEKYDENFSLPSVFFSEGTISVIALVIALFFEEKSVVIIEEPERYIHPSLLAKLVELMKDASRNKQVIITTHSPEIVKYAGLENLLLVQRDKEGFTTVTRPADNNMVKTFLHSEIGLDDLYIDNLLGA